MWWQVLLCCFAWQGDLLKLQYLLDRCQVVKQSTFPVIWHCLFWLQTCWSCQCPSKGPLTITGCSWDTPKPHFSNTHKPPRVWDTKHWLTLLKGSRKVVFQRSLTSKYFTPKILGCRFFWTEFLSCSAISFLSLSAASSQAGVTLLFREFVYSFSEYETTAHEEFSLPLMAVLVKSIEVNFNFADHTTSCFTSITLPEVQKCKFYWSKQPTAWCQFFNLFLKNFLQKRTFFFLLILLG